MQAAGQLPLATGFGRTQLASRDWLLRAYGIASRLSMWRIDFALRSLGSLEVSEWHYERPVLLLGSGQ